MKKASRKPANDMLPEYDFASMTGGVRGKYATQYRAGTNLVLLDPEVAEAFPTDAAVNQALRAILSMTKVVRPPDKLHGGAKGRRAGERQTPASVLGCLLPKGTRRATLRD